MTPHQRRVALFKKKIRLVALARELGVSAQCVHRVVQGQSRSLRVEAHVANALGLPVSKAFPPAKYRRVAAST